MDIQRCFEILELDHGATIDDAKQAYKDLVNIWHPDRFSNNPRLRQKAEEKLKDVNEAYDTLKPFLSSKKPLEPESASKGKAGAKAETNIEAKDKTEAFVEAGTGIVLSLFSYLSSAFRRIIEEAKTEIYQGDLKQWQKGDNVGGKGRGMGSRKRMGRGRPMGRGGGRGRGQGYSSKH